MSTDTRILKLNTKITHSDSLSGNEIYLVRDTENDVYIAGTHPVCQPLYGLKP